MRWKRVCAVDAGLPVVSVTASYDIWIFWVTGVLLPGNLDAGTGGMVLGVVPGVGPVGSGSGQGSSHFLLRVVTFNSPSSISRSTVRKQAA